MEDWKHVGELAGAIAGGIGVGIGAAWRLLARRHSPEGSTMDDVIKEVRESREKQEAVLKEFGQAFKELSDRQAAELRSLGDRFVDALLRLRGGS